MRCTICDQHTPDSWIPFTTQEYDPDAPFPANRGYRTVDKLATKLADGGQMEYSFEWMRCANGRCNELVVRVIRQDTHRNPLYVGSYDTWRAVPQFATTRYVDPLVQAAQPEMARDYREASLILDLSHRASAMLSRRILADLLDAYADLNNYRLSNRVDTFMQDNAHPIGIRENLGVLRSIGDFAGHTKKDKDDQAIVVDVTREEAEWTLDVVDRLFDYFIVTPTKDKAIRDRFNEKRQQAGQNPLPELSQGTDQSE